MPTLFATDILRWLNKEDLICNSLKRVLWVIAGRAKTAKFGDKREDVIKRMLEFMDDGTRNMVKRLCILVRIYFKNNR